MIATEYKPLVNSDAKYRFKFDSGTIQNEAIRLKGKQVKIWKYGWRIPILSMSRKRGEDRGGEVSGNFRHAIDKVHLEYAGRRRQQAPPFFWLSGRLGGEQAAVENGYCSRKPEMTFRPNLGAPHMMTPKLKDSSSTALLALAALFLMPGS